MPELHRLRTIQVHSTTGVLLTVVDIPAGAYATNPVRTENERQVEFYDTRYPHTILGQFITGYFASTLVDGGESEGGLILDGGQPNWRINGPTWAKINEWLKEI
jgi:hypothetical protein